MKKVTKVAIYITSGLLALVIILAASLYFFKDRIIQEFIKEANKSLNTPVKIGKIEISTWQDFPNLAIVFTDVYVEDSQPGEYPLLTAKKVSFYMNPIEAWRGNYSIRGLQINNSETNLKINAAGKNNFTIANAAKDSISSISFDLKNVRLLNTVIRYHDQQIHQHHIFTSEKLTASIGIRDDLYKINATGDITTNQIEVNQQIFLKEKKFEINALVDYDDKNKLVFINSGNLKINKSTFDVTGTYGFKQKNLIDIKAEGKETTVQTLLALLPEKANRKLTQYQSKGDVFFTLTLKGEISEHKDPFISIAFGCKDATFFHPEYQSKIEHANLEGSFASPELTQFKNAELFLKNMKGELNGKEFSANLSMQNFENPYVAFDFKGELDATSIQRFYPIADIKEVDGSIKADFSLEGNLALLKKKSTAQQVKTNGVVELANINFSFGKQRIRFKDINGSLQFNNNDLAMSNLKGQFENSDFLLNGFFKNIVTFLIFEDQPIGIEADLKSNFLDVDQLFSIGFGEDQSKDYHFSISPNLHLNFNCDVSNLKYKRFHPQNIKGNLLVKNQVAVSRNIVMKAMGGELSLEGIVDAKNSKTIEITSAFKLKGIHLDSVFYVFKNFYQDFIQDKHLRGQAFADVTMDMTLNENLTLISKTLTADISATIKNGELNDFEPLKALNKYLDDESLSKLRFADLKNDIHIENETIYIPQMDIKSNATVIQVSGTHTFDQKIDYRVIAPLRSKKKIDPDAAFGAIEEDTRGQTKLFLKITGTTDQYEISYDKGAVKKKIISDLKKEVQELKDAFKLKGKKKKKELELEKDEYFDWDN